MLIRKIAATVLTVTVVSIGGTTLASASTSPSPQTFTQTGDWADAGCIPTTWDNGAAFDAWALDTYTATVHVNKGFATEGGMFTAYCDPTTGGGFVDMSTPLISGTFSGLIGYKSGTDWGAWGHFTYYGDNGWTLTEAWNSTNQKEAGVPANTAYYQTENFYLG
jgi:hypothetical protein